MSENEKSFLILINDGLYGNEKPYNALRVAMNLARHDLKKVRVFLIGDGVQCAIPGQ
jgi:sulfur relay (sulfurtransferase) complex TusBCD TusD component (DsrE family)